MGRLVDEHPALMPVLAEHLVDQEGEILPHILIGEVEKWCETNFKVGQDAVQQVLDWLEARYEAAAPVVQELIVVSFCEMLPYPTEPNVELLRLLGPVLRREARRSGHRVV